MYDHYNFLPLKMVLKTPDSRPNIVNVPPITAQIEVKNSYHFLPCFCPEPGGGEGEGAGLKRFF